MIERLNQLSLYDFIELSCGDCSVLLSPDEDINEMELKKRSSDLIIEYKKITNPSGLKSVLVDREDMIKERARVLLFKVCISLIAIDAYEDVRETLALLSYDTNPCLMNKLSLKLKNCCDLLYLSKREAMICVLMRRKKKLLRNRYVLLLMLK